MPEHNQGQMGGTMRLGRRKTLFIKESVLSNKKISNWENFKKLSFTVKKH